MPVLKTFADGGVLEYGRGRFDDHCVFLTRPAVSRHAPRDKTYFETLRTLGDGHGSEKVYADFVWLYDATTGVLEDRTMAEITHVTAAYGADGLEADVLFSILYAAMVAEERKAGTKLGKRVKRLGVHQVLVEGMAPEVASDFSRGLKWRAIAAECERRGF